MSNLKLKKNPTLADIQRYVIEMEQERGFSGEGVISQYLMLVEEVGELCKVLRKHHTTLGMDADKEYELDAAAEIADIQIMLCAVANRLDVNIEQAFRDKEERNKKRTWK